MHARKKRRIEAQQSDVPNNQQKNGHTCRKTSFDKVVHQEYKDTITAYIKSIHLLGSHATFFIKYYMTWEFHNNNKFPMIDSDCIEAVLYLLNKPDRWNPKNIKKAAWKEILYPLVRDYCALMDFNPLTIEPYDQQPINYLTTALLTNLKVNVQEHFMKMLLKFINCRFEIRQNRGKPSFTELLEKSKKVKDWICSENMDPTRQPLGIETLTDELKSLNLPFDGKNDLPYLVKKDPLLFLPSYCVLNQQRLLSLQRFAIKKEYDSKSCYN